MKIKRLLTVGMAAALVLSLAGTATAAQPRGAKSNAERAPKSDNLKDARSEKQTALRQTGLEKVLKGEAKPKGDNKVVKVAPGQYVELARTDEDSILTIIAEFGDAINTTHHNGGHGGTPGPLHNEIPEPDRSVDNTTIWTDDFSESYYEDLLFSEAAGAVSMRNYYIEQSSNLYTVNGDVSPWVQVPYNAASYGSNYCGDIVCQDTWRFINDSADAFAATFPDTASLNAYLAQYDVWDRFDLDGDGNFDEPDGYIDHFQAVHAGEGEETGGGAQGTDAIWSHRWAAYQGLNGPDGPGSDVIFPIGGLRIGNSDYWIRDYTVEPENGGVGVFAHEFGHDLGLPDLYDTSGNTGGAENSTGFWTLYSSGSYGSSGQPEDGIGSEPVHMGNFEKFQMGWLAYEVAFAGVPSQHKLGPAEAVTKQAQGVFVVLPDREVPLDLGDPCDVCGTSYFYSGSGDDLNNTMTRSVAGGGALTAKVRYDIEPDFDYAFVEASTDGGANWLPVATNLSEPASGDQSGLNASGTGWSGDSGGAWIDLNGATLPAGTNAIRFRYNTDGGLALPGFQVDQIAINGTLVGTAESDEGWAFDGFRITTGDEIQLFFNAYILANRQYIGFDESLRTGPYNFGWLDTAPNLVEHFPYHDGLLVEYWNSQYTDNNVGDHPGEGLVLPVDAHPEFAHWADGTLMRPRNLAGDATFGLDPIPALTLHSNGQAVTIPAKKAAPVFSDSNNPWTDCDSHGCTGAHPGRYQPGWYSVNIPDTGTTVRVKSVSRTGFMQIDVNK